jgi:hypothetical protein
MIGTAKAGLVADAPLLDDTSLAFHARKPPISEHIAAHRLANPLRPCTGGGSHETFITRDDRGFGRRVGV